MRQMLQAVRRHAGDSPTENTQRQVVNFVGPTLVELGLSEWVQNQGGMVSQGYTVIESG